MRLGDLIKMTPGRPAGDQTPAQPQTSAPSDQSAAAPQSAPAAGWAGAHDHNGEVIDLQRRRDQLGARVAELQWDLGGLVYEMAVRDRIRVDLLVKRAAMLQDADAELGEVERILRMEQTGTAGQCPNCMAPHSANAAFCWQCGQSLMRQVPSDAISAPQQS